MLRLTRGPDPESRPQDPASLPDTQRELIKSRTESHSDVADTPPVRALQKDRTERVLGDALVRRLRELGGERTLVLRNLQEEWVSTDEGLVHELSVEAQIQGD